MFTGCGGSQNKNRLPLANMSSIIAEVLTVEHVFLAADRFVS